MLKRICPALKTDVDYDTFCLPCDFYERETTGCIAMKLGDRDLIDIRRKMAEGDTLTSGKFSKTGRK